MSATANLVFGDERQFSGYQIVHDRSYIGALGVMIDIDANLLEPHQGTHADPSGQQRVYVVPGQKIDGDHASPLDMLLVLNRRDLFDFSILHIEDREHIAVSEVP